MKINIEYLNKLHFKNDGQQFHLVHHKKVVKRYELALLLLILFIVMVPRDAFAQSGIIYGEIKDAETNETLPGAHVLIKGTDQGVSTDVDGRFTLRGVSVGEHIISIQYMGFLNKEVLVSVTDGERKELNLALTSDWIQGDEVFVVARQRGQSRALTRQRNSPNIRSVVSSEQMDRFADATVSGALQRIAGMGHGGANIRGVGAASSNITMDGQRMGTTGSETRTVDLGTISVDMVQELEVIKVITPDMDADAMSGVINISTRRPVGGERNMNVRLGGGANTRYIGMGGPSYRTSLSFGDSPTDKFAYGVNFSYQRSLSASESVSMDWGIRTFGDTPVDVLSSLTTALNLSPRERYGTSLQLTFQPTERTTFHVQGMFNLEDRDAMQYVKNYDPKIERYMNPTTTGPMPGEQASFSYRPGLDQRKTHQYTFQVGGRNLFDRFDLEYKLGWGHGNYHANDYDWRFISTRAADYVVDISDRWNPTIEFAPHSVTQSWPNAENMPNRTDGTRIGHQRNKQVDNDFKGSIDLLVPFQYGSFKFGFSGIMNFKKGNREDFRRYYNRAIHVNTLELVQNGEWQIFDRQHETYHIPWMVDVYKARDFYYSNIPNFDLDLEAWVRASETRDFLANENTFAGYGMSTLRYGRLTFLGGVRVEHSINRYDAREAEINFAGVFVGANNVSTKNLYTYLFPNAQFVYALGTMTNVRLAYSRSIGRPSFRQLSSYVLYNHASQSISRGNPELKPMISDNLDFLFEHYFMNVGQLTFGLFYKDMSDFVYSYTVFIREGSELFERYGPDFEGYEHSSVRNGEVAIVYGLEVSWQQQFDFLPGFLSNTGIYSNYSYAFSKADVDRHGSVRLQGQRPHVVNVGFDYSQSGFSGQISYQWRAPSISSYGDRRVVPGIVGLPRNTQIYFDRYSDASSSLSMSLRYRLTSNFRLWADASLLNNRSISYYYNRDVYPNSISQSGRSVSLGVRYSF